mmetsp:Transcript_84846/g.226806  ORF Transcript_84846/g.226806 Transcript_84846/m.226806 type:complete len:293 (-) Transcript_84846:365-1243(-)
MKLTDMKAGGKDLFHVCFGDMARGGVSPELREKASDYGVDISGTAWWKDRSTCVQWMSQIVHVLGWHSNTFLVAVRAVDRYFARMPHADAGAAARNAIMVAALYSAASMVETADGGRMLSLPLMLHCLENFDLSAREARAAQDHFLEAIDFELDCTTDFDVLVLMLSSMRSHRVWGAAYGKMVDSGRLTAVFQDALNMVRCNIVNGVDLVSPMVHVAAVCTLRAMDRAGCGFDPEQKRAFAEDICGAWWACVKPVEGVADELAQMSDDLFEPPMSAIDLRTLTTHQHRGLAR